MRCRAREEEADNQSPRNTGHQQGRFYTGPAQLYIGLFPESLGDWQVKSAMLLTDAAVAMILNQKSD